MSKRLTFSLLIFIVLLYPALRGYAVESRDADIIYKVTIGRPAEGKIDVVATFNKVPDSNLIITEHDLSDYMNVAGLKAHNEEGQPLTINTASKVAESFGNLSEKRSYTIESKGAKAVTVEYYVKLGSLGKHGHMGYLDERFGLVSGHTIFLFPTEETTVNKITVDFKLPQGWEVVSPWEKDGDTFVIERNHHGYMFAMADLLGEAVIGFGSFKLRQKEINGFNIKIYAFSEWPDEHIDSICKQAFRCAQYQLDLFEINKKWDYTVIFVPNAADKDRVFGGSWSLGQGFEMEVSTTRGWELFSHRVHHVFNRDYPFGMDMTDKSSEWFLEATASYYEVKTLSSLGYYKLKDRIAKLKSDYDSMKSEYDVPLSVHHQKHSQSVEYLHYTKAPLVAYLMDEKIKKDTHGEKDLDKFLKYLYSEHGMHKSAINLKKELSQFTGIDFNEFFTKYVNGTKVIELPFDPKNLIITLIVVFISAMVWLYSRFTGKAPQRRTSRRR